MKRVVKLDLGMENFSAKAALDPAILWDTKRLLGVNANAFLVAANKIVDIMMLFIIQLIVFLKY